MKFCRKHPFIVLGVALVATVFFALQIPNTVLDNDVVKFLPKDHPAVQAKNRTDAIFGDDVTIAVGVLAKQGSILDAVGLQHLAFLTEQIKGIPAVGGVTSLSTLSTIEGTPEGLQVTPILDTVTFDGSPQAVEGVKKRLLDWAPFKGTLYSADLSASQILVKLSFRQPVEVRERIYHDLEKIIQQHGSPGFEYHIAGTPALTILVSRNMRADLALLIPIVALVVIIILAASFRTWSGVLLPLLTVTISTIWTVGLVALLGFSLSMVATVIPVLMMAVGTAYGIHLVHHYREDLAAEGFGALFRKKPAAADIERHGALIDHTLRKVGLPILLAGLTTIAGFGSLALGEVLPIREFGIFTAFGVTVALVTALTVIPALLSLRFRFFGASKTGAPETDSAGDNQAAFSKKPWNRIAGALAGLISRHPGRILVGGALLLVLAVFGASQVQVDNILVEYFKEDTSIRASDAFLRKHFVGTKQFSLTISGPLDGTQPRPGSLTDPRALDAIDRLARYLEKDVPHVARVLTFADFVKKMNAAMHYAEEQAAPGSFSEIPLDPAKYGLETQEDLSFLISQYLLLYSGNLSEWLDDGIEPGRTRVPIYLSTSSNRHTGAVVAAAEAWCRQNLPAGYTVEASGTALLEDAVTNLIVYAQLASILGSVFIVFIILLVSYRSVAAAAAGTVPLVVTVVVNFGIMGFFGITINIPTAMVASVSIGIGIDYAIHMISNLLHQARKDKSVAPAAWLERSLTEAGPAILSNALSVGAGFAVLLLSQFNPLLMFGLLVALTMLISSAVSMTLLPAVLYQFKPRFLFNPKQQTKEV